MEVDYEDVEYDEEDFVGAEDLFSSDSESEAKEENVPPDEEAKGKFIIHSRSLMSRNL